MASIAAIAREMRDVLKEADSKLRGKLRQRAREVVKLADDNIPATGRIGKQIKFRPDEVRKVVERHKGDKKAAAEELGCSLRTIYTALDRNKS